MDLSDSSTWSTVHTRRPPTVSWSVRTREPVTSSTSRVPSAAAVSRSWESETISSEEAASVSPSEVPSEEAAPASAAVPSVSVTSRSTSTVSPRSVVTGVRITS